MDATTIEVITGFGIPILNFAATKVYGAVSGQSKSFFWKSQYQQLTSLKASIDFETLKRKTRIVVIDDEDGFPEKLFLDEGYSIDKWDSVKDLTKLLSGHYDIIILDIKGIATHISDEDGLGVLESLKQHNPAQIVVAFSQHTFDLSKSKFWELADEKIAKPSDFLKIKKIIDSLIKNKFRPARYIDILHHILKKNGVSEKDIKRLDSKLVKCIESRKSPDWNDLLLAVENKSDLHDQISIIGNSIIKFYQ